MVNQAVKDIMVSKINHAVRGARDAADVIHMGMRGTIREIAVENLFKPLLTTQFAIGNGKIIDQSGRQSSQTDVIIYSKSILPAVLYSDTSNLGLYPVEACAYAIEVKSAITAAEIEDALEKARQLQTLEYHSGVFDNIDTPMQHRTVRVMPVIFAFGSDLTGEGKSELERYIEHDPEAEQNPLIRSICVVGKGCWSFKGTASFDGSRLCKWIYMPHSSDYNEVLGFLSITINTIGEIIRSRGDQRFGGYLQDLPIVIAKESVWKYDSGRPEKYLIVKPGM